MTARSLFLFIFSILLTISANAQNTGAVIDVKLSPAGSFKAETAKVKGHATKSGDTVTAENIEVDINSIKTGVDLRDKHLKERLLSDKYPVAKLIKAEGKGGKGKATVEVKGIKKEVTGTYKVSGNTLQAQFKMSMTDLEIKDTKYMGVGAKDEVMVTITVPIK